MTAKGKQWKAISEGMTFGRLTVISKVPNVGSHSAWNCKCACGTVRTVKSHHLYAGRVVSCGCYKMEKYSSSCRLNESGRTPEYATWVSMRRRCRDTTEGVFKKYGGRGITVCDRWDNSFEAFLQDMGPRPSPKHSIDRINNNGNYEPGNCRWATMTVQQRNTRKTRLLTFEGRTMSMADWAEVLGMNYGTLCARINNCGWSIDDAIRRPLRQWPERECRKAKRR